MVRIVIMMALLPILAGADWPQILGPKRDGHSSETKLRTNWAEKKPVVAWSKEIGRGWSGFVVAQGQGYLFHRVDDQEVLVAMNPATGEEVWKFQAPTAYRDDFNFDDGPRATPTVHEGTVYTLGANGDLHAIRTTDGRKQWHRNLLKDYNAGKGYFGVACSPLVTHRFVVLNVGGPGAGLVAFDPKTGAELWKTSNDEASYSSPVLAKFGETELVIAFTRRGLLGVELATGKQRFDLKWRSRLDASVNAATPLILDDHIFLTASYGTGAILLKCDGKSIEEVWSNDQSLSCQYSTPIRFSSELYGTDGRADFNTGRLRCVDWKTGEVKWTVDRFGCASLIGVGENVLAVSESGDLVLFRSNSQSYTELGRFSILQGKVRAVPSFADGRLYARDEKQLVCIDCRPE